MSEVSCFCASCILCLVIVTMSSFAWSLRKLFAVTGAGEKLGEDLVYFG